MNTRRLILHLIVGLLSFLLGVTAAIALGGFNPLARLGRSNGRNYTIPQQSLSVEELPERYHTCPHSRPRLRTAEMHSHLEPLNPPAPLAPVEPIAPFDGESVPPPSPRAPRAKR